MIHRAASAHFETRNIGPVVSVEIGNREWQTSAHKRHIAITSGWLRPGVAPDQRQKQ